jgi:hypothetical protein
MNCPNCGESDAIVDLGDLPEFEVGDWLCRGCAHQWSTGHA